MRRALSPRLVTGALASLVTVYAASRAVSIDRTEQTHQRQTTTTKKKKGETERSTSSSSSSSSSSASLSSSAVIGPSGARIDMAATLPRTSSTQTAQTAANAEPSSSAPPLSEFRMTFAVPMHCQACVDSIEAALREVPGVSQISSSLSSSTITTSGTAAPSAIQAAIASTGRDAIVRGSGSAGANSAAVAILETAIEGISSSSSSDGDIDASSGVDSSSSGAAHASPVRGLVRMVQVGPGTTVCDVSLKGLRVRKNQAVLDDRAAHRSGRHENGEDQKDVWGISVRRNGDISRGADSAGEVWDGDNAGGSSFLAQQQQQQQRKGWIGEVRVDPLSGSGEMVGVARWEVWEVIGRGLVVERLPSSSFSSSQSSLSADGSPDGRNGNGHHYDKDDKEDEKLVLGVIARSAGTWENDKTVCSCSGKTVWEEREEQRSRGMV